MVTAQSLLAYINQQIDYDRLHEIEEAAQEYYGEDNVDLQIKELTEDLCAEHLRSHHLTESATEDQYSAQLLSDLNIVTLYIRFRDFTISNERNESATIEEMFVKLNISIKGLCQKRDMFWQRTVFSDLHYNNRYAHSHLNTYCGWERPCLGTGPIVTTFLFLSFEYDIFTWRLFFRELDLCIQVESLEGVPYKRIASVKTDNMTKLDFDIHTVSRRCFPFGHSVFKRCLKVLLENKLLPFVNRNGTYIVEGSTFDLVKIVSDAFIRSINDIYGDNADANYKVLLKDLFMTCEIHDGVFYRSTYRRSLIADTDVNIKNFIFKGQEIKGSIKRSPDADLPTVYRILLPEYVSEILYTVNTLSNYE